MLRREGLPDNVKRVYQLYRKEGLSLRLKRSRRNKAAKLRQPKQLAHAINEIWSMDFVSDALFDGRKLRMLTVVRLVHAGSAWRSRRAKALRWRTSYDVLNTLTEQRGLPKPLKSDSGSEFISKVMDRWAYERALGSWTSAGQGGPWTMPAWRASTADCVKSA